MVGPVTARLPLADDIVQGRDTTLRCPLYRDGELVPVVGGAVTITDASGLGVVDAAPVVVASGVATYAVAGALTADRPRGDGWLVAWVLQLEDGRVETPRNPAALVLSPLYPVITDEDLIRRLPALDPARGSRVTSAAHHQDALDEAWIEIQQRLIGLGNRPNLIMQPAALRPAHIALTLALVLEGLSLRAQDAYADRAAAYREQYRAAWDSLSFRYDVGDTGRPGPKKRPASPTLWLSGR